MKKEWVRSIRDQCSDAGVAFFFKQWGGARKKLTGRTLDGRTHDDVPLTEPEPDR
jgi:protein gp37